MAVVPAMAQESAPEEPQRQRYLSDIRLHRDSVDMHVVGPKDDRLPRLRRSKAARPWPGPDVAYEVQPWSDGAVTASGWCFALDREFAGLGRWVKCAGY
jgi:hypothetical protein